MNAKQVAARPTERDALLAEVADVIAGLGPVADQLGSRTAVAQYEADIGDPGRTRAGTSFAGSSGPLPRFLSMRDIVRMSFNIYDLVPPGAILRRVAGSTRLPVGDNLANCLPYAPTLRDALDLSRRYVNLTLPWFCLRLDASTNDLRIVCATVAPLGRIEPLSLDLALFTGYRTVANIVGLQVAAARIHFGFEPLFNPAARYACPITFGGGESHLAIPLDWCDRSNPHHDPALWEEGLHRCEADLRALQAAPIVRRVRQHIATMLDLGSVPTLADTSASLGLSTRTMVRLIGRKDTTHHQLVEEERRRRAGLLLGRQELSIADIAEMLGFPDQSSFGRKCLTWFEETPAKQRQRLVAGK
jgi:AraC-like DNA-binding protein